jgi:L-alanine-DL-glutamate epimerase-like enolase superfamily enzyme
MTRITKVLARTIPLRADISNALVSFAGMTGSVVALIADSGTRSGPVIGYGFGSIGRYAQTEIIRERMAPRIMAADPKTYCDPDGQLDPVQLRRIMLRNEKPGGHGERSVAVGAIDMAAWDLVSKSAGLPLYGLLSRRFGEDRQRDGTEVYAAGGYYHPGGSLDSLRTELSGYLESGYRTVKIKIGGTELSGDIARIEAAINVVGDPARIAVDANGRFQAKEAVAWGKAIEPYGLRWYEEPGDPLDFKLQRTLAESYPHPMATGENLFSSPDVQNLLRYAGLRPDRDILQMDPGLSYGLPEYLEMISVMKQNGWKTRSCFPHGGNLFNLHVAIGLNLGGTEAYPGVFAPFGGFGESVTIKDGRAAPPDRPGIGWETKPDLMAYFNGLLRDNGIDA